MNSMGSLRYLPSPSNLAGHELQIPISLAVGICRSLWSTFSAFQMMFFFGVSWKSHQACTVPYLPIIWGEFSCTIDFRFPTLWLSFILLLFSISSCSGIPRLHLWLLSSIRQPPPAWVLSPRGCTDWGILSGQKPDKCGSHAVWFSFKGHIPPLSPISGSLASASKE